MRTGIASLFLITLFLFGCSGGQDISSPDAEDARDTSMGTSHYLWGLWMGVIDPDAGTVEFTSLRSGDFHINVIPFLEPPALVNLTLESIEFNGNIIEAEIGLRHPFLGLTEFTGFDVCGIFITNGSVSGFADSGIVLTGQGDTRLLNPDGLSRWWNPAEFPLNTGTIFGYTDGLLGASDSFANYNATLNGYKYYCHELDADMGLDQVDPSGRGVFNAGQALIRHYTIELGNDGLVFNYAVDASWTFPEGSPPYEVPDDFPQQANRVEAWWVEVQEISNTLYNDGVSSGGELHLSVYDWFNVEMNTVTLESPGNFSLITSGTPMDGGIGYSTYAIDITSATPQSTGPMDILISVVSEEEGFDGFISDMNTTAYFVHTVDVADDVVNHAPVCSLEIVEGSEEGWDTIGADVEFDATGSYDPDDDELIYHWDFDGDGNYDETEDDMYTGSPDNPVHTYTENGSAMLWVEDGNGGEDLCEVEVTVTLHQSKNILLRPTSQADPAWAVDLALDHQTGDLYILYNTGPVGLRTAEDFYQEDDEITWKDVGPMAIWIDVSGDSNVHISFTGLYFKLYHYEPDGDVITYSSINLWGMEEQIAFGDGTGPYANDVFMTYGEEEWNVYSTTWFYHYDDTTYNYLGKTTHTVNYPDYYGCGRIKYQNINGIESDKDCKHIWVCEGDDVARFSLDVPSGTISQDGPCINDGGRDISRDNQNNIHVLDYPNKIKMYDPVTGTKIGEYGDNTSMNGGQARAIEGSDYNGNIFVIHGTPDQYYKLSIFFPDEMPE